MIFLGAAAGAGLGGRVMLADFSKTVSADLSGYPPWLVVLIGTFVAVLALWILMKLLKWTLWLLLFAVLIGGLIWSGSLLLQ